VTAWEVLHAAVDLLDLVVHWRFYLCFLTGLALSLWIHQSLADHELAFAWSTGVVIAGAAVGLVWELKS
jgi:hypothetical protein